MQVLLVNLQIEATALDRNGGSELRHSDYLCVQLIAINAFHLVSLASSDRFAFTEGT